MDNQQVLIVEDEALLQQLSQGVLEEAGFAVIVSISGEEAIEHLQRQDRACVALVTDVHLTRSGATGWDVARRARELTACPTASSSPSHSPPRRSSPRCRNSSMPAALGRPDGVEMVCSARWVSPGSGP